MAPTPSAFTPGIDISMPGAHHRGHPEWAVADGMAVYAAVNGQVLGVLEVAAGG